MLRTIAGGLGLLLKVVGRLGQGVGLIGGSFMTGRGRWAVTGGVMIAIGICLLARPGIATGVRGDDGARRDPSGSAKAVRRLSRDVLGRAVPNGYPQAFVEARTGAGWPAALIPEEYAMRACPSSPDGAILEEISASGGNAT